jgi:hypothetical protein
MKYFKPELLERCRSKDDDVAEAAAKEWDQAIVAYRKRLREIRAQLPIEVRNFCNRFTLHDASVVFTALHKVFPLFTALIQLKGTPSQPGDAIQLLYATVAKPHVRKASTSGREWILYNEFDLAEKGEGFTHSLLLTDSSEIQIAFQKFDFKKVDLSGINVSHSDRGDQSLVVA